MEFLTQKSLEVCYFNQNKKPAGRLLAAYRNSLLFTRFAQRSLGAWNRPLHAF